MDLRDNMANRTIQRRGVAGLLVLVGLVALWLTQRTALSADTGPETGAASATAPGPSGLGGIPGATGDGRVPPGETPVPDHLPMPACWEGVLELEQSRSLATLRLALSAAVAQGDPLLMNYLRERLTELIGNDSQKALEVVGWTQQSFPPELDLLMDALKLSPAVQQPRVAERLLAMADDKGASLTHRAAAISALETQERLSPAAMQRLKAVALDETVDSVAWLATRTIGRVMTGDLERGGDFNPYWKELLGIAEKSDDAAVRALALEMPSYGEPLLGKDSIDRLAHIMRTDRERDVRDMAALRLSFTESPQTALDLYRDAWATEHDECVRWALFRFAVRVAGKAAFPVIEQFAAQDARFAPDLADFRQLYADGTTDWARVWMNKPTYHSCIVEEGAPH